MAPVHADAVTDEPAEEFVAGHTERACLCVEKGVLDCADGLTHHATRRWSRTCEQRLVDLLVVHDGAAEENRGERLDGRGDAWRAEALVELRPAGHAVGARDLHIVIVPPAGVARERLDSLDRCPCSHGLSLAGSGVHQEQVPVLELLGPAAGHSVAVRDHVGVGRVVHTFRAIASVGVVFRPGARRRRFGAWPRRTS